jgi:hypothetical protein
VTKCHIPNFAETQCFAHGALAPIFGTSVRESAKSWDTCPASHLTALRAVLNAYESTRRECIRELKKLPELLRVLADAADRKFSAAYPDFVCS